MLFCGFMLKTGVGLTLQLVWRETDKCLCCGATQDTREETLQGEKRKEKGGVAWTITSYDDLSHASSYLVFL